METHAPAARFAHPPSTLSAIGVEPGIVVADFGAGSGVYTLLLAQLNAGRVYAIDVQHDLLRRISNESKQRGFNNIEVLWGDVERPGGSKIADRIVDLVLMSNLLFQLEAPAQALSEGWRVLKPTGRLAIVEWDDSGGAIGPHPRHLVTPQRAVQLAQRSGFTPLESFDAGSHHYGLIFRPIART